MWVKLCWSKLSLSPPGRSNRLTAFRLPSDRLPALANSVNCLCLLQTGLTDYHPWLIIQTSLISARNPPAQWASNEQPDVSRGTAEKWFIFIDKLLINQYNE